MSTVVGDIGHVDKFSENTATLEFADIGLHELGGTGQGAAAVRVMTGNFYAVR